ncbi:hypothetical protein FXO37_04494 [Capsicum annuum]|nr:hypothetical protein FXO37_04494 [Capsicum annuum]
MDAPVRRCERLALDGFRRGRGRPKKYWGEVVRRDMEQLRLTEDMTLDRKMRALQLFVADEGEASVVAPNIFLVNQPSLNEEKVGIGTDAESEEEDNNEPVLSDYNSEELEFFRKEKHGEVNDQLDMFLELEKGMFFKKLKEAKRVVDFYSIANKKGLQVDKSDTIRLRYVCDVGCPFECLISEDKKNQGFKIKTLNTNHTCLSAFQNRRAIQDALAHYFKKKIQNNPKYKVTDMRKYLSDMLKLNVSYSTMKRVKRLILEKLEGSYIDEFNKLEAYAQELRESNPATDVIINLSKEALNQGKRRFLRMYVCFQAWKNGWKADLADGEGLTFISDMQKELLNAISQVYPKAHHRWCVRHIEANWSKIWISVQMKKLLWWSAWSTYEEEFHDQLKEMRALSEQAVKDLVWYPAQHWCRAYFDTVCKNSACENNFTGSFNKWILNARENPIIKMLDEIKTKVMVRLKELEEEGRNWKKKFNPYVMELYTDYNMIKHCCEVKSNGYQVVDTDGDESEEDEQPTMQPKRISKAKTRLEAKKVPHRPTGIRKIGFKRDENGARNQRGFCEIYVPDPIWIRLALKLLNLELRLRKSPTPTKFFISNWRRLTPYFLDLLDGVSSPEEGAPFGVEFFPFDGELRRRRHRRKLQTVVLCSNANF